MSHSKDSCWYCAYFLSSYQVDGKTISCMLLPLFIPPLLVLSLLPQPFFFFEVTFIAARCYPYERAKSLCGGQCGTASLLATAAERFNS